MTLATIEKQKVEDPTAVHIAWIECQKELENPKEKSRGNYANYAKLEDILRDCLPILNRHGFSLHQSSSVEDGQAWMNTFIEYRNGKTLTSKIPIYGDFKDMMKFGAGLTYARRYSLCMLLGIEGEKDLDGDKISAQQIDELYNISKEKLMPEGTPLNLIEYAYGYHSPEEIDQFNFDRVKSLFLKWKLKTVVKNTAEGH